VRGGGTTVGERKTPLWKERNEKKKQRKKKKNKEKKKKERKERKQEKQFHSTCDSARSLVKNETKVNCDGQRLHARIVRRHGVLLNRIKISRKTFVVGQAMGAKTSNAEN